MTRETDWRAPGGHPAPPRLLAIMAQFDRDSAALDQADIARLANCSRPIAQRRLVTLAELGYLTEADNGAYRLAGVESEPTGAGHNEDGTGTLDTAT
jgi:hypothetical protein